VFSGVDFQVDPIKGRNTYTRIGKRKVRKGEFGKFLGITGYAPDLFFSPLFLLLALYSLSLAISSLFSLFPTLCYLFSTLFSLFSTLYSLFSTL